MICIPSENATQTSLLVFSSLSPLQNVLFNGNYLLLSSVQGRYGQMNKHQWHERAIFNGRNCFDEYKFYVDSISNEKKRTNVNRMASKKLTHWLSSLSVNVCEWKFNSFLAESHICCCLRSLTPCIAFNISRTLRAHKRPCNLFICKISNVITIKTIFGAEQKVENEWKWMCGENRRPAKNACLKKK